MPVLRSLLDNDLYKFTMQKAVLDYRPGVTVRYAFNNRRPEGKFNAAFAAALADELPAMESLALSDEEYRWLRDRLPWLEEEYLQYLRNYRYDAREVRFHLDDRRELQLEINGPWERTILWEVPLMAVISELYFRHCDTAWTFDEQDQQARLVAKGRELNRYPFSDFGTRRRRNYQTHFLAVKTLMGFDSFAGTSNVHLAHLLQTRPIGTMAHEFIMGISALESLRHANKYALKIWSDVYRGNLGIALTDTFGTDAFFEDFDGYLARLFDGVRHDSGDPLAFAEKAIAAYCRHRIDPTIKTIVFSDALDAPTARRIGDALTGRIRFSFGIGTNFTNDFPGSPALNMAIKMSHCAGVPVVKLSDTPTKAIGDRDALRVARWTFFGTPLDEPWAGAPPPGA